MKHPFNDYIVVEFSLAQKAFHKQSVNKMLETNIDNMARRKQTDYMPIGIFSTDDLADEFIELTRDRIKDYSMYRSFDGKTIVK